jgi:hypothetical protein
VDAVSVTYLYCPLCGAELDCRLDDLKVELLTGETIEAAIRGYLALMAREQEAKVVAHLEARHPVRYWLHRKTSGRLGIQRSWLP